MLGPIVRPFKEKRAGLTWWTCFFLRFSLILMRSSFRHTGKTHHQHTKQVFHESVFWFLNPIFPLLGGLFGASSGEADSSLLSRSPNVSLFTVGLGDLDLMAI